MQLSMRTLIKMSKRHLITFIFLFALIGPATAEESFKYDGQDKRDPFWPLVSTSGIILNYETDLLITDLILEGIMLGSNTNIAIINGKIIKEGDKLGNFQILRITKHVVTIDNGEQKFELKLKTQD